MRTMSARQLASRIPGCALRILAMLAAVIASPAWSQQLKQPPSPSVAPSASMTTPPTPTIRSDPSQRRETSSPIPAAGPAQQVAPRAVAPVAKPPSAALPQPVRDRQGRIVPGAVRTSPTSAYDPATGRVMPTLPQPAGN